MPAPQTPPNPAVGAKAFGLFRTQQAAAGRIVFIYALFAALWILVSDRMLIALVADPEWVERIAILKGWLFVAITSGLLYTLLRLDRHRLQLANDASEQAAEALHNTNLQLRWLEDNLPGSYIYQYMHGSDGRPVFLHVSAGVEKLHQLKAVDVLQDASRLHRQTAPEQLAGLLESEKASLRTMADFEQELLIHRPDGQTRWLQVRSRPTLRPDGQVVWDGVATDVTAQRHAAQALRESEERLRTLIMLLPDALFINQDGRVVFANQCALKLWRAQEAGQVLGRSPLEFFHPDEHPAIQERIVRLLQEGGIAPLWETRIVATDGTIVPVETTASLHTFGGRPAIQVVVRDITERKRAMEVLRAQQAMQEETGRIAKVGGWNVDVATGRGVWTPELAHIHDFDPADPFTMERGLAFYSEESRPKIAAAVKNAIEHGQSYDLELEIVSAKGVRKWVRTIGHAERENGRVVRLRGSLQDITEKHRMDEERAGQQRRMALLADISRRLVLSDSPAAILEGIFADLSRELEVDIFANYMVSPEGDRLVLESCGGLTEEQRRDFAVFPFGVSLCGLVAQKKRRLVFADLPAVTEPQAAGIIALGVKAYAGHPLLAGDRLIGTVSFGSRRRLCFGEEDVRLMKAVADQVSAAVERHRLLAALRAGEERFRQVVENIQEVFWMSDVAKSRVIYISPGFETIWGRSCESVYASMSVWFDSLHPEDRDRVVTAARVKQVEGTYHETYRIVRPDGSVRWVRDRAFPIKDASGQVVRVVGVAEDITDRRELEARFLRSQRLEAIGTLAGGVAHDLNNILAPVLMISGLLKERLPAPEDRKILTMLESSARRGAGIIRQLLTFSRGTNGEQVVVQLRHLLKELHSLMRETFPRDIEIREHAASALWPVLGDPTQLHQVLMNLCVNARDAMPAGGVLTLAAENATLTAAEASAQPGARPGSYAVIVVRDTGQGIRPEVIERIFDPFFTTKETGKGTGLGLSTVLGIAKSHGGFVTVRSEPGLGAEFKVWLPAADPGMEPVGPPEEAEVLPSGRGELILVVDDEPDVITATRLLLEIGGYRVVSASNGREALVRFLEHQEAVRLILTDSMMPVMGGPALVQALRTINPEVPIVATTGLLQEARQAELAELGVTDIVMKPCRPPELLRLVRKRLDG